MGQDFFCRQYMRNQTLAFRMIRENMRRSKLNLWIGSGKDPGAEDGENDTFAVGVHGQHVV